jgi:hypothetical protein
MIALPQVSLVKAGGLAAALAAAFAAGWHFNGVEHEAALLRQENVQAQQLQAKQAKIDTLASDLEAARQARQIVTQTITRDVIRYANSPQRNRCALSGSFRMLHDAAATGTAAESSGPAAASAAAVDDAAVLETVTGNYTACRENTARLTGWQQWWAEVGGKTE